MPSGSLPWFQHVSVRPAPWEQVHHRHDEWVRGLIGWCDRRNGCVGAIVRIARHHEIQASTLGTGDLHSVFEVSPRHGRGAFPHGSIDRQDVRAGQAVLHDTLRAVNANLLATHREVVCED